MLTQQQVFISVDDMVAYAQKLGAGSFVISSIELIFNPDLVTNLTKQLEAANFEVDATPLMLGRTQIRYSKKA